MLGGLFERLQLRNTLRHLFLLGGKLLLRCGELPELLLRSGELFLLGNQILYATPDVNEVLHQRIKLLRQFRRWCGRGGRCCCLCGS